MMDYGIKDTQTFILFDLGASLISYMSFHWLEIEWRRNFTTTLSVLNKALFWWFLIKRMMNIDNHIT